VAVLHVLQPFKYADPAVPIKRDDIPMPEVFEKLKNHPGVYYRRLREQVAERYARGKRNLGVWYVDLAEALPAQDRFWLSWLHASPEGAEIIANRLLSHLIESKAIILLNSRKDGKTVQHDKTVGSLSRR
jgi:hypothetical protein